MTAAMLLNRIRGLVRAAFVLVALAIFVPMVIGSYSAHLDARDRIWGQSDPDMIARQEEEVYQRVCPRYAKASKWERWTSAYYREISWCENYLDRLPANGS